MGLSAAQARYLFISNRTNQIENSLMKISNKQLILADKADEIAYQKSIAENTKVWSLNGLNDIGYNELMGDTALTNNQLNLITTNNGADSKIVLDNRYANAVRAAAIGNEGGVSSVSNYNAFLTELKTPTDERFTWDEIGNNITKIIPTPVEYDTTLRNQAITFRNNYGINVFNTTYTTTQTVDNPAYPNYDSYSSCINYGIAQTLSGELVPQVGYTAYKNASSTSSSELTQRLALVKEFFTTKYFYQDGQLKPDGVRSLYSESQIEADISTFRKKHGLFTLNGNTIDDGREFAVIKGLCYVLNNPNTSDLYCNESLYYLVSGTEPTETIEKEVSYTGNAKGKSREEWNSAYNNLSSGVKEILSAWPNSQSSCPTHKTVNMQVRPNEADKATYERYKTLFINICETGWTEDADVQDKKTLIAKLENATYFVNSALISSKENSQFTKVALSSKINIDTWYDNQIKKIKEEEQSLESKSQLLQTQLIALSTEEESVKAIIDKNIERSFNLFG